MAIDTDLPNRLAGCRAVDAALTSANRAVEEFTRANETLAAEKAEAAADLLIEARNAAHCPAANDSSQIAYG